MPWCIHHLFACQPPDAVYVNLQPFSPEIAGHPVVLVSFVVNWKMLDVFKAARVLALSNRQRLQLLSPVHVSG